MVFFALRYYREVGLVTEGIGKCLHKWQNVTPSLTLEIFKFLRFLFRQGLR